MSGIFFDLDDLMSIYEGDYKVKQGKLGAIPGEGNRQSQESEGNSLEVLDADVAAPKADGKTLATVLAFLDKQLTAKGISKDARETLPTIIDAVKAGWSHLTGDREIADPSAAENALRELQANFDTALDRRLQEIGSSIADVTGRMTQEDRTTVGSYLHREVRLAREETAKMLGDRVKNMAARGTGIQDIIRACWPAHK